MLVRKAAKNAAIIGRIITLMDIANAVDQSIKQSRANPVVEEVVRQTGGWGGAAAGSFVVAAAIGASGPVGWGLALAGGAIGGYVGSKIANDHAGSIADKIISAVTPPSQVGVTDEASVHPEAHIGPNQVSAVSGIGGGGGNIMDTH